MIGTYAAVVAVCAASLALGQAAIGVCGHRRWSWLSPAVGLALLCAICWGTVRLPGHGTISAIVVLVLVVASVAYLWRRLEGGGEALRAGWPVALVALLAASIPFVVEGHFGILGTSFNPDMSQHLLATDRLADGHTSELLRPGLPARPALDRRRPEQGPRRRSRPGLQRPRRRRRHPRPADRPLRLLVDLRPIPRTAGALVVGLAYVVASYFAQGAFKETIEALFVLAFALSLRDATRPDWRDLRLRFVPVGPPRRGRRLRLQLPGPDLAGRHLRHLGGRGIRRQPHGALLGAGRPLACPPDPDRVAAVRRPRRARDRPHDRLPQVRNLRPQRPGPRQPLRPGLALRGARDLALGRLPSRSRRRRRARGRLLPRRRLRAGPAPLRDRPLLAPARVRRSRRAGRRGDRLRGGPRRRHALHRRQGDRGRGAAGRADDPPAAARGGGLALFSAYDREKRHAARSSISPPSSLSPPLGSARCSPSPTPRSGRPPIRRR